MLRRIAAIDSQRPLADGPVLLGELTAPPQAALSMADGRVIANPSVPTAPMKAHLRLRATAYGSNRARALGGRAHPRGTLRFACGRPLRAAVDVPAGTPGRPRGNPGQRPNFVHRQPPVDPKARCVIT
jgi:hypothetical protein